MAHKQAQTCLKPDKDEANNIDAKEPVLKCTRNRRDSELTGFSSQGYRNKPFGQAITFNQTSPI
jgi:hypothetical protein